MLFFFQFISYFLKPTKCKRVMISSVKVNKLFGMFILVVAERLNSVLHILISERNLTFHSYAMFPFFIICWRNRHGQESSTSQRNVLMIFKILFSP